ncbi:MAG: nitrogen fixation protein NifW [Sulfurimonas sp.]|jgi:nitrogenase-stabilizing/protective protein|nr:nitrogen fixation protein NifW [Sulfurimonas sp.]MBU1216089.1 nitrogenase-stabilizing/protective protein NifW [bacterium]MBU1434395.1 nitrogenase-stabilizing/protective protein NifW [bacterium]MBU1501973.1 nitrogenase-stabilizing/protective protein NifW [bacterium]MBU3939626.1 nitrogenase-stabilizing/protective protein NifW [bacterium]
MSRFEEFSQLTDTEEFFDFFDLEYDERLVYVKRFHIMKKYGEMLEKGRQQNIQDENKLLDFYKFALISVYKNFENGYSPSAADVWNTYDNPSACSSCSTSSSCNDIEEVSNGVHSCTSQPNLSFN